jgi:anionic cell wall polymer biosynthesis LytR-Cps2A-Psr (LCP) family protein
VLDGQTASAFLRAREGTGNGLELGSDLGRITRQQQVIKAAIARVQSSRVLTGPVTVMAVLAKALWTRPDADADAQPVTC